MRKARLVRWALVATALSSSGFTHEWQFDRHNDLQGWSVPQDLRAAAVGGAIWMSIRPPEEGDAVVVVPVPLAVRNKLRELIASPRGLSVSADGAQQIRVNLELINLSPLTDIFLKWKTSDRPQEYSGSKHCPLKSDLKAWQSVTCYMDVSVRGPIDQVAFDLPFSTIRGDLWIRRIQITAGDPAPPWERPDLASDRVVPRIRLPGITQAEFADAFKVLDECLTVDVPLYGFTHPVLTPDGHGVVYGEGWWEEDSSVGITGAKWANPRFAEDSMRGFHDVQALNPDGRIDAYGWKAVRGQVADRSQSPQYFQVAYDVARRSSDVALQTQILETMQKYLDWWLSPVKRDAITGLISGVDEESFGQTGYFKTQPQTWAPVDLNVDVAVGAALTSKLAANLHRNELAERDTATFQALSRAINTYLWDEKAGAYYEYDLHQGKSAARLWVSTFYPLRHAIAPPTRRDRLLKLLLNPKQFNWGKMPLPSLAMTDPEFESTTLKQTASSYYNWTGDVWMVTNMPVVLGLRDSGREDLAAELNWAFVKEFNGNYRETLLPMNGQGIGALRYQESASLYIQAVIEHLFGIDCDAIDKRIRVKPLVPKALYGKSIGIWDVILPPGDARLSVQIKQASPRVATVTVEIAGELPKGELEMELPGSATVIKVAVPRRFEAQFR